jgi:hypothetical protein
MTVISIEGHPREEELADYAADMLAQAQAERLESHVFDCPVCARRLQRAASLQMALHEAVALEAEIVLAPPRRPAARSWLRKHVGAVSALWASAAAVLLMLGQQGSGALELRDDARSTAPAAEVAESSMAEPSVTGCDPTDPRCADGLLASIDPLQSVDPLSSSPDDPFFASSAWDEPSTEGEPCGSGEDGGPLVCQPFSG